MLEALPPSNKDHGLTKRVEGFPPLGADGAHGPEVEEVEGGGDSEEDVRWEVGEGWAAFGLFKDGGGGVGGGGGSGSGSCSGRRSSVS